MSSSQSKYFQLVKQFTAIEMDLVSQDSITNEDVLLTKVSEDEQVILKSHARTAIKRAQVRTQVKEARQQKNIEAIFSLGVSYLSSEVQTERLDLDWLMRFIELAEQSYSPNMQDLWAKILAVELSTPGSFSVRSLTLLAKMSIKEAKMFYRAVNLMSRIGDDRGGKIVTGAYAKPGLFSFLRGSQRTIIPMAKYGLSFSMVIALAELGLLHEQEIETAALVKGESFNWQYHSSVWKVTAQKKDVVITYFKFTPAGMELSKLVSSEQQTNYAESLKTELTKLINFATN